MSTPTVALARLLKDKHPDVSARTRIAWARAQLAAKKDDVIAWNANRDRAEWEADGFTIVAKVSPDYDSPDLSYLGEYSDRETPGAIKRRDAGRNEYAYFIPTRTEEEHYTDLRAMKYGRAEARDLARKYVRQDYKRMEDYDNGWWYMTAVTVSVYRAGIELARDALYGIESDSEESFFTETARDLATEALEEAREKVHELCASTGDA